jgi:hypothetical protein
MFAVMTPARLELFRAAKASNLYFSASENKGLQQRRWNLFSFYNA